MSDYEWMRPDYGTPDEPLDAGLLKRSLAILAWIGISSDEASRMKPARQQWMVNRWPLIERNISRHGCLAWLERHGHPEPPKSACIGCPFRRDTAWIEMRKNRPDEWSEAVEIDAALRQGDKRGLRATEYMHDLRMPLSEAIDLAEQLKREQPNLFENECEGVCGV
jgi:hypothetical protein